MKTETILGRRDKATIPYDVAKTVRELVDAAKVEYGHDEWENDDCDHTVISLVFDEESDGG